MLVLSLAEIKWTRLSWLRVLPVGRALLTSLVNSFVAADLAILEGVVGELIVSKVRVQFLRGRVEVCLSLSLSVVVLLGV